MPVGLKRYGRGRRKLGSKKRRMLRRRRRRR